MNKKMIGRDLDEQEMFDYLEKIGNGGPHDLTEDCWCEPTIERFENGNVLVIHNEEV